LVAEELSREPRVHRKILREDQPGLQGIALGGKVAEQVAEPDEIYSASALGQGWVFLVEAAEPAEQMGIAAQLGELAHLRKIRLEIEQEAMGGDSKISVGSGESLDASIENLGEFLVGRCGG